VIDDKILCMHGGVGDAIKALDQVRNKVLFFIFESLPFL
jgi:hypothetical protein